MPKESCNGCIGIAHLAIPEGAQIGVWALHGCRGITEVSIPLQLSIEQLRESLPDLNPSVTRRPLSICVSIEGTRIQTNTFGKRIAFVFLLCQQKLNRIQVPNEMLEKILSYYQIKYLPTKTCPLNSDELFLTDEEATKVEEYNQLDGSLSKYKAILPS